MSPLQRDVYQRFRQYLNNETIHRLASVQCISVLIICFSCAWFFSVMVLSLLFPTRSCDPGCECTGFVRSSLPHCHKVYFRYIRVYSVYSNFISLGLFYSIDIYYTLNIFILSFTFLGLFHIQVCNRVTGGSVDVYRQDDSVTVGQSEQIKPHRQGDFIVD